MEDVVAFMPIFKGFVMASLYTGQLDVTSILSVAKSNENVYRVVCLILSNTMNLKAVMEYCCKEDNISFNDFQVLDVGPARKTISYRMQEQKFTQDKVKNVN